MSLFGPTLLFVLVATFSTHGLRWRKVNLFVLSNSLHPRFWPLQQASLILKGKQKNCGPSYRDLRPVCSLGQKVYISFCLCFFFYIVAKSVWCELLGPELWSMKKKKRRFLEARGIGGGKNDEAVEQCLALCSLGTNKDWKQYSWLRTIVYACEKKKDFFFLVEFIFIFAQRTFVGEYLHK